MSDGIEITGLTIGASAVSAIIAGLATWWKTKNKQPVEISNQPIGTTRPSDGSFVTQKDCEYRMGCFRRDFVEEVRRLYDKVDEVKVLIMKGQK